MTDFVLDASVGLAWFIDRTPSPYATRVARRLTLGSQAIVPALWHLEMANGLALAERRGTCTSAETNRFLADIESLLAAGISTDETLVSIREVLRVATTFRLSA